MFQKIYLVGAFDRHNYGDILFPIIHSKILLNNGYPENSIEYVAVSASDMREIGGYKTISIKELLSRQLTRNDLVVLCGGDILSADWLLMLGNLTQPWINKLFRISRKILGVQRTNILAKNVLGQLNHYPYIISNTDTQATIIYTAVGGAGFVGNQRHISKVADLLRGCHSVSVRDHGIESLLKRHNVKVRLIPDTALPMSALFSKDFLNARHWKNKVLTFANFDFSKYFVLQGAKRLLSSDIANIVEQIKGIHAATGYAPLLVPIGKAADHEDHIPLTDIYNQLKSANSPCAFLDSEHVMDIMAALANATCYIGTSLHGAITSYSFHNKVVAIQSEQVPKLKDFLNTWVNSGDYYLSNSCLFKEQVIDLITNNMHFHSEKQLEEQIGQVTRELLTYELSR